MAAHTISTKIPIRNSGIRLDVFLRRYVLLVLYVLVRVVLRVVLRLLFAAIVSSKNNCRRQLFFFVFLFDPLLIYLQHLLMQFTFNTGQLLLRFHPLLVAFFLDLQHFIQCGNQFLVGML